MLYLYVEESKRQNTYYNCWDHAIIFKWIGCYIELLYLISSHLHGQVTTSITTVNGPIVKLITIINRLMKHVLLNFSKIKIGKLVQK